MSSTADEHWHEWLTKFGDKFTSDEERSAAYRAFKARLAVIDSEYSLDGGPSAGDNNA